MSRYIKNIKLKKMINSTSTDDPLAGAGTINQQKNRTYFYYFCRNKQFNNNQSTSIQPAIFANDNKTNDYLIMAVKSNVSNKTKINKIIKK